MHFIFNGGEPIEGSFELPALTAQPSDYSRAIQSLIDATAAQRGYASGASCASYLGSTNAAWAAEAQAFVAWRDAVWIHAYAELAKVEAGERPQPAVAAFVEELPPIAWPA